MSISPGYKEFILAEMYRSRDTRDAERVAVTPQEPNSIENQQVFEQWTPEFLLGMKEETDRTGSVLKAGLHFGLDCGLRATCPVSMEVTYQLENQTPPDGRAPELVPRLLVTEKNTLIICVTE